MKVLSILMLNATANQTPTPQEMERMERLIKEMKSKGALIDTGGTNPGALELQVSRRGNTYAITDGPFTESKEVVGGFALLEVSGRDEAIALTRQFLDVCGDATCYLHEVSSPE
jgi:hypothetical protein